MAKNLRGEHTWSLSTMSSESTDAKTVLERERVSAQFPREFGEVRRTCTFQKSSGSSRLRQTAGDRGAELTGA